MGDNGRRLEEMERNRGAFVEEDSKEMERNRGAFVEEDSKENGRQWQKTGRDGEKQRSICRRRF